MEKEQLIKAIGLAFNVPDDPAMIAPGLLGALESLWEAGDEDAIRIIGMIEKQDKYAAKYMEKKRGGK